MLRLHQILSLLVWFCAVSAQYQQQPYQQQAPPPVQPYQQQQTPVQTFIPQQQQQTPIQAFLPPQFQTPIQEQTFSGSPVKFIQDQILNSAMTQVQDSMGINGPMGSSLRPRLFSTPKLQVPRFCAFHGEIKCDPDFPYRMFNGSCNNLNATKLWWGKAEMPYKRYLPHDYGDLVNSPRLSIDGTELPNARSIACSLHSEAHEIEPFITHMFMQWGQLITHDISSLSITTDAEASFSVCNSCTRTEKCFPIPIANNLTCNCILQMSHDCIEFTRSSSAFGDLQCTGEVREQLNLQTSFLDASLVYGTTKEQNDKLRDVLNGRGRLIMQHSRRLLPKDKTKDPSDCLDFTEEKRCFVAGDDRVNQNPGLMTLQTILMREHNRIADILSKLNPSWEDETVFQETRRIIIAMVQHITYNEYLPILLGESVVTDMNLKPLPGTNQTNNYDPNIDPRTSNEFASGAGRFGHSMIRSIFSRADKDYNNIGSFMLRNSYFRANMLYDENGLESVTRGFLKDPIMKVDRWFTDDISKHLFETLDSFGRPFHFDLVSINIQRGRDHGLPGYLTFREFCRLTPITSWADMRNFVFGDVVDIFMRTYKFVEDVDLFSAAVSEIKQDGAIVGPTLTCMLANQFHDIKFGDRFWYETSAPPASFTPNQLGEIKKMSLSKILCRNLDDTPIIQPRALLSSKIAENALMNCTDLTDINWRFWKI